MFGFLGVLAEKKKDRLFESPPLRVVVAVGRNGRGEEDFALLLEATTFKLQKKKLEKEAGGVSWSLRPALVSLYSNSYTKSTLFFNSPSASYSLRLTHYRTGYC